MQNLQNKIDKIIQTANEEFSKQSNVIGALVEYSRTLELYTYLDRYDYIQQHEVLVRIAICWDILGNYQNALIHLTKALELVPNISKLIIYKSILEQSLNLIQESTTDLLNYKHLIKDYSDNINLYHIFRIVYYYTNGAYERKTIVKDINEYFDKYNKCTILLFLRAKMYFEMANEVKKKSNMNININITNTIDPSVEYQKYIELYEHDITMANEIEGNDTASLIKDGISKSNLTKLFFMTLPEMDYYQPKPLVEYQRFHCGFGLFYTLFKIVKVLKFKLESKKLRYIYNQKVKRIKAKHNSNNNNNISNNSNSNNNINNNNNNNVMNIPLGSTTTKMIMNRKGPIQFSNSSLLNDVNNGRISKSKSKSKSPAQVSDRKIKAREESEINKIKQDYQKSIHLLLNSTPFLHNKTNQQHTFESIMNMDNDYSTNYFIRKKYYAPFNLSKKILEPFNNNDNNNNNIKKVNKYIPINKHQRNHCSNIFHRKALLKGTEFGEVILQSSNSGGCIHNNNINLTNELPELSVSAINVKKDIENDTSALNDIQLLDNNNTNTNTNNNLRKSTDFGTYDNVNTNDNVLYNITNSNNTNTKNNKNISSMTDLKSGNIATNHFRFGVKSKERGHKHSTTNCNGLNYKIPFSIINQNKKRKISPDLINKTIKMKLFNHKGDNIITTTSQSTTNKGGGGEFNSKRSYARDTVESESNKVKYN